MHVDYNAISYERRLASWHLAVSSMPPPQIGLEDVADIGAYVRGLRQSGRR